ncbi:hypothetical protein SAY87_014504 [Trapa incisa]|uniref:WRKY domain-containing protein n=1 Tax=Trapa incisa TaxID=236973 RepID=A0AAN7GVQ4_9MYRT|nr:hypothetical protein SAY87_014504 [Trapa incisa]
MEGGSCYEEKTLISELILGVNLARQLRVHLSSDTTPEAREVLIKGILNSYDKALLILQWSEPPIPCQTAQPVPASAAATGIPESPLSVNGSPNSNDFNGGLAAREQFDARETPKKRKMLPKWTNQVKISPDTGLEGPQDDGYNWRKYGQKDILGAKFPRSYYRCTYRNTQNCWATKQVQRSDDDPTVFEITYRGKHTCALGGPSTPAPASPDKQESSQIVHGSHQQQDQQPHDNLTRFRTGLRVETDNLDGGNIIETPCTFSFPSSSSGFLHHEAYSSLGLGSNGNHHGSSRLSSPFLSPSTTESSYFSVSQCPVSELVHIHNRDWCGYDIAEIVSATNSSTNSPIPDLGGFSLAAVDIDPNFTF